MSNTSGPKSETCDIACRTCSDYPYPSDMQGMVKNRRRRSPNKPIQTNTKTKFIISWSHHLPSFKYIHIYIYVCACSISMFIMFYNFPLLLYSFLKDLMFVTFSPCPLPWVQAWGWIVGCYRHDPSKPRHSSPVSGNCHGETKLVEGPKRIAWLVRISMYKYIYL